MANQPSKYSKFLIGAASAALVASAVAPVASAADFKDTKGNTHEEAINALSDAGVIKGYSDGTFLPNKTLTRSDVVKMMGKWLVTEGHSIPTDARTNPRFTDLSTKTNAELLDYAAVVKDAGVFIGSNGKLLATDNITRENMALVLVRAFDTVNEINLVEYVNAQEFTKDVKDLSSAKKEAQAAINVLDFFDITNPTVASFNPKGNTTRGHFATFLHKTINADFSLVTGVVTGAVKAINATTVEVTLKEKAENVSDFTIEGLKVTNAVVKQSDDKVVVLTTEVQEGGKKYTVSHAGKAVGTFEGLSAVIPTKIDITTQSVQGKVGAQAVLTADVGVKQAGIPVTFNVDALGTSLNKDQVVEAVTNADGIATFSYTQYAAGTDSVVAYPTGAPAVRSLGYVFWGVDSILAVEEVTTGATINNGANKTYKVTYKNATTGKVEANQTFNVALLENINVAPNQVRNATVNGTPVKQLSNNTAPVASTITTDSKGEATFTVSGTNAEVTPVVYAQNTTANGLMKYETSLLQANAPKVKFSAQQTEYVIELTRDGGEVAAFGFDNGRKYKVVIKDKAGNLAKNEVVNVAFHEDIDRVISTVTSAKFVQIVDGKQVAYETIDNGKKISVTTDSKGEASFVIGSGTSDDYATPYAWIDINSSNANDGNFDEGEPFTMGSISYFQAQYLDGSKLVSKAGTTETDKFKGAEVATFEVALTNQSGKAYTGVPAATVKTASYTVTNTGANSVKVTEDNNSTTTISPNRSHTVTLTGNKKLSVVSVDQKTTSVKVTASGVATTNALDSSKDFAFTSKEATVTFTAATDVTNEFTGVVTAFDTDKQELVFSNGGKAKYAGEAGKTYKYWGVGNTPVYTPEKFVELLQNAQGEVTVTREVKDDVVSFYIVTENGTGGTPAPSDTAEENAKTALEDAITATVVADYVTADQAAVTTARNAAITVRDASASKTQDYKDAKVTLEEAVADLTKKDKIALANVSFEDAIVSGTDNNVLTLAFTHSPALTDFNFDAISANVIDSADGSIATVANGASGELVLTVRENDLTTAVDLDTVTTNVFVINATLVGADKANTPVKVTVKYSGTAWVATVVAQ